MHTFCFQTTLICNTRRIAGLIDILSTNCLMPATVHASTVLPSVQVLSYNFLRLLFVGSFFIIPRVNEGGRVSNQW